MEYRTFLLPTHHMTHIIYIYIYRPIDLNAVKNLLGPATAPMIGDQFFKK
jgi:hypothetical protein